LLMAQDVSSIAWNAERTVQCVLAALASSTNMDNIKSIGIELDLPLHKDYSESWYTDQSDEDLQAAKDNLAEANVKVKAEELLKNEAENNLTLQKNKLTALKTERDNNATRLNNELLSTREYDFTVDAEPPGPDYDTPVVAKQIEVDEVKATLEESTKAHKFASEKEESLKEHFGSLEAEKNAADESGKRSQRLLLGSVGVGIAMLSSLVYPIKVELRRVSPRDEIKEGLADVAALYVPQLEAVRLSEACLVISRKW